MDIPVSHAAMFEEAQKEANEFEEISINPKTSGSEIPKDNSMHHVTSLNSPVVCWRPKQDNHVGGNQSGTFPLGSFLNTEGEIGTSSLSSLSQEVSQCGVSATALPCNTEESADSYPKEELENRPVIESSFVSESITNTVQKSYETDAEMMNDNSKTEDSHIGQMILDCTLEKIDAVVGLIYSSGEGIRDGCSSKVGDSSHLMVNAQREEVCGVNDGDSSCKEVEGKNEEVLCEYTVKRITEDNIVSVINSIDSVHDSSSGNNVKNIHDNMVRGCSGDGNLSDIASCLKIDCRCIVGTSNCSWVRRNNVSDDIVTGNLESDGKSKVDYSMLSDIWNNTQKNDDISDLTGVNKKMKDNFNNSVTMDVGDGIGNCKYNSTRKRETKCNVSGECSQMLGIRNDVTESSKNANQNASKISKGIIRFEEFDQSGKTCFENPHNENFTQIETPKVTSRYEPTCHSDCEWNKTLQEDCECSEIIQGTSKCSNVLQSNANHGEIIPGVSNCEIISSVSNCDQTLHCGGDCTRAPHSVSRFDHVFQSDTVCDEMILTARICDHIVGGKNLHSFGEFSVAQLCRCGSWNHKWFSRQGMEEGVLGVNCVSQVQNEAEFDCDCCSKEDAIVKNRDSFNVAPGVKCVKSRADVDNEKMLCEIKCKRNGQPYTFRDCDRDYNRVVEVQAASRERLHIMESFEIDKGKAFGVRNNSEVHNTSEECSSDGLHEKSLSRQKRDMEGTNKQSLKKRNVIHKSGDEGEWKNSKTEKDKGGGILDNGNGNWDDSSEIENEEDTGIKDGNSGFEKDDASEIEGSDGIEKDDVSRIESVNDTGSKEDANRIGDDCSGIKEDSTGLKKDVGGGIEKYVCRVDRDDGARNESDGYGIEKDDENVIEKDNGSSIERDGGIVVKDVSRIKEDNGSKKDVYYINHGEKEEYSHINIRENDNEMSSENQNGKMITKYCAFGAKGTTENRDVVTEEKCVDIKIETMCEKNDREFDNLIHSGDVNYIPKNICGVSLSAVEKDLCVQESNIPKDLEKVVDIHIKTDNNQDETDNRKLDLDKLNIGAVTEKVDLEDTATCGKMKIEVRYSMNFDNRALAQKIENSKDRIVLEELKEVESSGAGPLELSKEHNGTINEELKIDETVDKELEINRDMVISAEQSSNMTGCLKEMVNSVEYGSENDKPKDSDGLSDKLAISKSSDNSYEEPEILRGLSSPSYEPETILRTCSPSEEVENLRDCNKPSDESHQGSGKNSKQSSFTKGVESTKRKRDTHENRCADAYVKTSGQLYPDKQRSHVDVIIDMINAVKEKVLSVEQQKHHVQRQKGHEVAHHSLYELREPHVIKHIQDHPVTLQDMSNKNSSPVGISKKRSHKNQVKGKVSYEKSHLQEMQQHPHTKEKKTDLEKAQLSLKLDRDKHFLEPCEAEERLACSAKDVLQSPSSVQQCWKYKDITAPLDFTKILNKIIQQLQKWKKSTQTPSFKIQALVYQLYIGLQEHQGNTIEEQCHAPPPPKKQRLLHCAQKTKCYVHKETQVHLQENLVNQKDMIQKDLEHELKSYPSGHQDRDFNDGKRKESKEMTKPIETKIVDGELCNFAPDLNIGTLLSDEQQGSVSILNHKEVIETDCVSTLLKEMDKGADLFCGSGNTNQKLYSVKNEVKGQSLGSLDHLPETQSEITILREFIRPGETSVNCSFPRSTSTGHTERSPAAKKQKEKNVHYEAKQMTCAEVTMSPTIRPVYTVAPGTSKTFSLPSWAMSGVHLSKPCISNSQPSINLFPPQGCQVVPSSLQAPNATIGRASGLRPWLKNKPNQSHSFSIPKGVSWFSSSLVQNPSGVPSTTASKLRPLGPPFYTSVRMPMSKQKNELHQATTPSSSYACDRNKNVTVDKRNLWTKSVRRKKDKVPLPQSILSNLNRNSNMTGQKIAPTQNAVSLLHLLSEYKKKIESQASNASQTKISSKSDSQGKKLVNSIPEENNSEGTGLHKPNSVITSVEQSEGPGAQQKLIQFSPTSQCKIPTEISVACLPQKEPSTLECEIKENQGMHSELKDKGNTLSAEDTCQKSKPYNLRNVTITSVIQSSLEEVENKSF